MEELKQSEEKGETMERIVAENFERFEQAMNKRDLEAMIALFADEFHFLPTLQNAIIKSDKEKTRAYFLAFFKKNPTVKLADAGHLSLSDDIYSHEGLYNFELDGEEERKTGDFKFTQIWKKENGVWKMKLFNSAIAVDGH